MRRCFSALLILCATAFLSPQLLPSASAQTTMPVLKFKERTLSNGLKVYSLEDHASPTVAIQVWYHVGSKDDPEGRSGFAHLFEHIMFKSTKNMKAEMMDRLTEDVGGINNAFTADDVTVYHEVVPSNYLETLIWAEADRLAGLNVDEPNFKSERAVVQEEFRQNYAAPPYGKLSLLVEQKSWTTHPYKRPGIGNIEELDAATIENVRAFHATYYRPDNATLIVAGDFDQKQLDAWVDKYFGRIPKPNTPLPRVTVKEPPRTAEKRFTEYGTNVPLPAIAVTYLVPPAASEDAIVLQVADAILSGGTSSRLYQSLVYRQQLALEATSYTDLREDASLFGLRVALASDKKPEDAERSLLAEIKRLQDEPVSKAELDKALNLLMTSKLREREKNEDKAQAIGNAAVLLGDPNRANTDIERLQSVTASDVQRIMKKYFTESNRVVITYLPEQAKPAAGSSENREERRNASLTKTLF
ncbi:MAG TPA: pitrilysin family protein [Pyrinomonadaceae bacterium]|jgi:zinc protease|nr:pitrilysin family protein [Pyrinomonadaceae bacterium]